MRTPPTQHRLADDRRHTSTTVTAASVAVLVAVTALVLSSWLLGSADGADPTGSAGASASSSAASGTDAAVAVLREWDRARAAAWADGDAAALAALYAPGSRAGERDVVRLRRWSDRGLRVEGMRMQVLRVDVRVRTARRLVLSVTDRLTGAVAVRASDGRAWALPSDRADTRRLEFRRTTGRWRLASVYDRPLARIAATSGSDIS